MSSHNKKIINRHGKKLLELLFRDSVQRVFGKYLSIGLGHVDYSKVPERLIYRYRVPPCLCKKLTVPLRQSSSSSSSSALATSTIIAAKGKVEEVESRYLMTTSGIMAVFDEFSTFALALEDRNYRLGVSVDLNTELLNNHYQLPPNSEVYVVTEVDKLGKTLGFLTMELYATHPHPPPTPPASSSSSSLPVDATGELIARGKHIRYLPHPHWVAGYFSRYDWLVGIALRAFELVKGRRYQTAIDRVFSAEREQARGEVELSWPKDVLSDEYVFSELLEISSHTDLTDYQILVTKQTDYAQSDQWKLYILPVKTRMCNGLGALHGGALAMAIEEGCRRYKQSRYQDTQKSDYNNDASPSHANDSIADKLRCINLDVKYLAPMKGKVIIKIGDDIYSDFLEYQSNKDKTQERIFQTRHRCIGSVYSYDTEQLTAEFSCEWSF